MEEIIREIVDADKQARRRVKEKQQERLNIQNLIQQQDDEIKSRYQQETKALLEAKQAELNAALQKEQEQEENAYQDALHNLEAKYDASKEEWVNEIIQRCLAS